MVRVTTRVTCTSDVINFVYGGPHECALTARRAVLHNFQPLFPLWSDSI